MRMILAVAIVSAVVLSAQAQAPSAVVSGSMVIENGQNGRISEVLVRFADGSELRADSMVVPSAVVRALVDAIPPNATTSTIIPMTRTAQVTGDLKTPEGTEFILSGNVRLKFGK